MDRRSFIFVATLVLLVAASVVLFLYARGFEFNRQTKTLEKTGMIVVKSNPDGARIYLGGKLTQATNATLTGLKGGLYEIKLEKDGYAPFTKDVPVKEEFVTNLEALLVPLNPELRPLTTTGVISPVLTGSRDKILFITADRDRPGLWSLNLNGNLFSLIRGNLDLFLPDRLGARFSQAEKLFLSGNDEEAIVSMNAGGQFFLDLTQTVIKPQATASAASTFSSWQNLEAQAKLRRAEKFKVPLGFLKTASDSASLWSPDERRFLYALSTGKTLEYHVYDTSDPLGIGEKRDASVLRVEKTAHTKVSWFADSKHLILTTCEEENEHQVCLSGNLKIIGSDGGNTTQIYSGALSGSDVFPTPDGTKLIILTTFNSNSLPNLYAIILK